jgi:hypothetical protein
MLRKLVGSVYLMLVIYRATSSPVLGTRLIYRGDVGKLPDSKKLHFLVRTI